MAVIYTDNFDRSDSSSIGSDWTEVLNDTQIHSNKLKNVTSGLIGSVGAVATASAASPPSADYKVSAKVQCISGTGTNQSAVGVIGRYASSTQFYYARINFNGDKVQLYKVNPSASLLGEYTGLTFNLDTEYTVMLSMQGSAIKAYAEGVERVSVTDTAITATGDAGTRVFLDNASGSGSVTSNCVSWDDFSIQTFSEIKKLASVTQETIKNFISIANTSIKKILLLNN